MKAKTINAILCKKFDQFLESIDDPTVKNLVKENTVITGGSIVSMLLNANVNDYDLYFRTKEVALAVAHYYVAQFKLNPPMTFKGSNGATTVDIKVMDEPRVKISIKSAGIAGEQGSTDYQYFEAIPDSETAGTEAEAFVTNTIGLDEQPAEKLEKEEGKKYRPVFLTANAITLSTKVQLILRFYGEPEEIHRNYDFEHCTNYWTSWERKLVLRPEALESILTKELRYRGSLYPICSVIRTRKFIAQGWTINAGQYLKMCWQISKLNLTDITVLEDQLIGVDAAYFGHLIEALAKVDLKTVDSNYVATVIDKIF